MRRRIGLATIAILTFLLSCEILLQLLGVAARAGFGRPDDGRTGSDVITILAVGDSHTYGTPLPREHAYPAQLEALLSREFSGREFRVLNRGVPGVNSAFVTNRLEQQILLLDPDLVIVWAGTNNRWNSLESESWESDGLGERLHRRLLHVKLYRLARVLEMSMAGAEDEVAVKEPYVGFTVGGSPVRARRGRDERLSPTEHEAGLSLDMERIVGTARGLGRKILFVTYPKETQRTASDAIAEAGERLGVPVVDSRRSIARAEADGHRPGELIVMAAGPHPTRLLYSYVVQDMLPEVTKALGLVR
jgi:hypothetical protein